MQIHTIFHFSVVDNALFAPDSLYLVIGFNDFCNKSENELSPISSKIAPNKALVAGGYFCDKRTKVLLSFFVNSFKMALNRIQADEIPVSGIFLILRIASSICNNGTVSFVIVFFCRRNEILYLPRLKFGQHGLAEPGHPWLRRARATLAAALQGSAATWRQPSRSVMTPTSWWSLSRSMSSSAV